MPKDKILHFIAGAALSAFGFFWTPLFSLGFIAGILKEVYDKYAPGHECDILDCVATWLGAGLPVFLWINSTL